ncbi:MFS transporter [Pseudomonas machongensis]
MKNSTEERFPRYWGWRVVVLCFTVAVFSWAFAFYGQSVYLVELQRLHGWSSFDLSMASTLSYLAGAGLVIFVGEVLIKLGPRRFLLGGVVCLGLAVGLLGQVRLPWQLYSAYLLLAVGWSALNVVAISTLIARWFDHNRSMAISMALTGASMGGVFGAPTLIAAIGHLGFGTALGAGGILMGVVLVPMILAWGRFPPTTSQCQATSIEAVGRWTRRRALRSLAFWSLAGPFALALFAQVGILVHLMAILEPKVGPAAAGLAISIISIMAVLGRLALGLLAARLHLRRASAVFLLSQSVALVLLDSAHSLPVILMACALFGLTIGNVITLPAMIVQREFDASSFSLIVGLSTAVGQVTYAFGPGLLGLLHDFSGSYCASILLCAGLLAGSALMVLRRP